MTIAAAPSGAIVVASVMQRTSDEETFYTMTAIANRRPLQVVSCQPLIKALFILFISAGEPPGDAGSIHGRRRRQNGNVFRQRIFTRYPSNLCLRRLSVACSRHLYPYFYLATAQALGSFPVLHIAYAGATGPIEAYRILATYYAEVSSVVVAVPTEGIYSTATRSDLDSNTMHSVVSLAAGFAIGTIPAALADGVKCGVRMRGFIRGPLKGAGVYTFTVPLRVKAQSAQHGVHFDKTHAVQVDTDRARAWVDNVGLIMRSLLFCD